LITYAKPGDITQTTLKDFIVFHLQLTIEVAYILIQAVIYGGMIYAMIGYEWTVTKFFWNLFFTFFTFLYFTFFGMMTVAITPNQNIAAVVASSFYGFWNLFSGYFLPRMVSMYGPYPLIYKAMA
jgi:hypothetical protein